MSYVPRNYQDLHPRDWMTSLFQGIQANCKWVIRELLTSPSLLPGQEFLNTVRLAIPLHGHRGTAPCVCCPLGELCLFLSESLLQLLSCSAKDSAQHREIEQKNKIYLETNLVRNKGRNSGISGNGECLMIMRSHIREIHSNTQVTCMQRE